jgi:hypothetical protein
LWVLSVVGENMSGLCVEIGTLCENALRLLDRNWQTRGPSTSQLVRSREPVYCAQDDKFWEYTQAAGQECPPYTTSFFFSVFFSTLAQVSFRATVRLNTGLPGAES